MLDLHFWREVGGAGFRSDLLAQDEGEVFRVDLRRATYAGKALGSKELLEGDGQQLANRVEYDQLVAVA